MSASRDNQNTDQPLLEGYFLINKKGPWVLMTLSKQKITYKADFVNSKSTIKMKRLIAATPCDCSVATPVNYCYYCRKLEFRSDFMSPESYPSYPRNMRLHRIADYGRHMYRVKSEIFQPANITTLKQWLDTTQQVISEYKRPKRLLVFINPYGGKKKGVKIYEKKVLPLFHLARIQVTSVVTQRPNHAKEMIEDIDTSKFDGIVCVGGDGMFSEVLNSVLLKTQKDKGIDSNDVYNKLKIPKIPLGIIPAGSTNAAVNCITGSSDPITATLFIIQGKNTGVDVCGVYSAGRLLRYAVTFLSYGYFGDVIRDSEKLRWMGPKRYDFSGFKNILRRKLYEGELQLLVDVPTDSTSWRHERCLADCKTCSETRSDLKQPEDKQNSEKKIRWMSVRGRFIAVNAAVMSCACCMSTEGISPSQHLGNGYCDVITVSSCSRLNYLRYLLRTSYHHSDPFDLSFVKVYRVREFKFNPMISDDKTPAIGCKGIQDNWQELNTSIWDCDGEIINEPSITAKIHCQLINVFGRGYIDRKKKSPSSTWSQCFPFFKKS
ncbi:Ceramide kinase like protein [Argiope bruennichi]|uniref:Ceramide kinase like protein n=1 Tax=Argiope bruennichi TaxID=94029 RepID=A0A8T0EB74_ARGBR|nr:Ceramide kinase like protein [Argiope bruennichi]